MGRGGESGEIGEMGEMGEKVYQSKIQNLKSKINQTPAIVSRVAPIPPNIP
jgi:hypothetical protein